MNQRKATSLFQLWIELAIQLIAWGVVASFGCLVMVYALNHFNKGSTALINEHYRYVLLNGLPNAIVAVNAWVAHIPTRIVIPVIPSLGSLQQATTQLRLILNSWLTVLILGLRLVILRLYLLSHWAGLFLLGGLVGLIDGITQRIIRRHSAARESALIYHHAKALVSITVITTLLCWLILPGSAYRGEKIIAMGAISFAFAMALAAKTFKKYL